MTQIRKGDIKLQRTIEIMDRLIGLTGARYCSKPTQ